MKALLFCLALFILPFSSATFDNSSYIDDAEVGEMLTFQYVKDINSTDLYTNLEDYLSNYLDKVSHVSGHYAKETNLYYYTVYGTKGGKNTFEMLEVDQKLFDANNYYKTSTSLAMNSCRRGNGWPNFPVCQGYCQIRTNGCLGIICPPAECLC